MKPVVQVSWGSEKRETQQFIGKSLDSEPRREATWILLRDTLLARCMTTHKPFTFWFVWGFFLMINEETSKVTAGLYSSFIAQCSGTSRILTAIYIFSVTLKYDILVFKAISFVHLRYFYINWAVVEATLF